MSPVPPAQDEDLDRGAQAGPAWNQCHVEALCPLYSRDCITLILERSGESSMSEGDRRWTRCDLESSKEEGC